MSLGEFTAIIQAAGSVVLLVVTGWYAWLTKDLAESARLSSASAAEAANASRMSLGVQLALIPITFDFDPLPLPDPRELRRPLEGIRLTPTGASIWLHAVAVEDVAIRYGREQRWAGVSASCAPPVDPTTGKTLYVQNGESWQGAILPDGPGTPATTVARSELRGMRLRIAYSIEVDGPRLSKIFEWHEAG